MTKEPSSSKRRRVLVVTTKWSRIDEMVGLIVHGQLAEIEMTLGQMCRCICKEMSEDDSNTASSQEPDHEVLVPHRVGDLHREDEHEQKSGKRECEGLENRVVGVEVVDKTCNKVESRDQLDLSKGEGTCALVACPMVLLAVGMFRSNESRATTITLNGSNRI
ncbi:hypothetical protein V6N11_033078 [Hibiscus sabdariffa]|uniref:Uncharacterized protein n=1 Tax=Hibiscus sabdariffa TaxID=183260 RepID=A0ABR1ZFE5_9ROSI